MSESKLRRIAIVGGSRIPFCRSGTLYSDQTNLDMLSAAFQGVVNRYGLAGQKLDQIIAGAVTTHSKDWNLAREAVLSTGIGNGVAMPHTRLEGLRSPLVVVGLSKGGIDFDAPDGHPAHVILMILTPVGQAEANDYGYGISTTTVRGVPALQHLGGIPGFTSHLAYVPGADVTVAVLQNSEMPLSAHSPRTTARRLAAAALGDPYPPVEPVALDAAVLKQYEGVYRVDQDSTRTLRFLDGNMTAHRTGGMRFELTPITADTFVYPDGIDRLQLLRDATGSVTAMRFWSEGEGEGDLAPLTDMAVPVDFSMPRDAFGRLVGRYWVPALLIGAVIFAFYAAKLWRRRNRPTANTI